MGLSKESLPLYEKHTGRWKRTRGTELSRWNEVTRTEAIDKAIRSVCENILRIALFVLHNGCDDRIRLVQGFQ